MDGFIDLEIAFRGRELAGDGRGRLIGKIG